MGPCRRPEADKSIDTIFREVPVALRSLDDPEWLDECGWRQPRSRVQLPFDVGPGRETMVEQVFHGDAVVEHWSNVRQEGESGAPATTRELDLVEVR